MFCKRLTEPAAWQPRSDHVAPGSDPATFSKAAEPRPSRGRICARPDEVILAPERGHLILLLRADLLEDNLRGLDSGFQIHNGRTG